MGSSSSKKNTSDTAGDAAPFASMLGNKLQSSAGTVDTASALAGKTVGLYFSAHWCPPCRGFTPALSKAYTEHLKAKGLEIVFVSSDRDTSAFNSYFGEMPWLALPFSARKIKEQLSEKFGVRGIPTLVVLQSDGTIVAKDARAKVTSDPTGKSWLPAPKAIAAPKPAADAVPAAASKKLVASAASSGGLGAVIGSDFVAADGTTKLSLAEVTKDAPLIGLYFSAHWCGPCRAFTPQLAAFVAMLEEEEDITLPVIFGSGDRDEASFKDYLSTMPWTAFPHGDPRVDALKSKYGVSGIPWLVILDKEGRLVANEADTAVPQGTPAYKQWMEAAKKPADTGAPAA